MTIDDEPNAGPAPEPAGNAPVDGEEISIPSRPTLWWPVVQALREIGRAASDSEITERVADTMGFTHPQRTAMNPSGHETKLRNRVRWAIHELKDIGAIHDPEPAYRALTALGLEVDEKRIKALRAQSTSSKSPATVQQPEARADDATSSSRSGLGLPDLVEQFRVETGYPSKAHNEQKHLREKWTEKLSPANILSLSRSDVIAFTNNSVDYFMGEYVKQVEGEPKWIGDLDDAEFLGLLNNIKDLCWGEDELSVRIDRLAHYRGYQRTTGTKGFAGSNVGAALAICLPDRFIPASSQAGKKWGRIAMLRRLGLPYTTYGQGLSFGSELVDANDRLRTHLAPQLNGDTQAMGVFLHWLVSKGHWLVDQDDNGSGPDTEPGLTDLAKGLLIDAQFLTDIVELLEDKGQVILYGPPGTGKTYLARALAGALAPDEDCRALVQFHPSTSYEDFFEGYRPAGTGADGGIRYELTPGPLARIAEQAEASDRQHVMIIDEINRGNLPRVLGELLFLLEYRDESVQTLYRPEEPFSLPENLWFIGTMNTADRSIALVDAALRRRFHFVPFFPDSGPMEGLLGRWLERQDEPGWIGRLVDAINSELKDVLEGSHLLLGPSHFMKEYGTSPNEQRENLRRIWVYNIEPFIEDQFFGDPEQIDRFRFNAVMRRHGPAAESDIDASDDSDDPESTNGSEGEPAVADGDAVAEPGSTPENER